jgi:hypothetical protein
MIPPGRKNDFRQKLERRGYRLEVVDRQNWVMDVTFTDLDEAEIYNQFRGGRRGPQLKQRSVF